MKDKTKKALILAVCAVVSICLIAGIYLTLQPPSMQDDLTGQQDQVSGEVNPNTSSISDAGTAGDDTEDDDDELDDGNIVVNIQQPDEKQDAAAGAGDSTGTEQTIQSDVDKPEADEDALTDPSKTPDGQMVDGPPEPVDHGTVTTPPPSSSEPQAGDTNDKGQIYVPGFGWIANEGGGTDVKTGDSDGDINKPVGIMGE